MLLPQPAMLMALETRIDIVCAKAGQTLMRTASYDGGQVWHRHWSQFSAPVADQGGTAATDQASDYGVAMACSGEGRRVYLCGRSKDTSATHDRFCHLRRSEDFGNSFTPWTAIGSGEFTGTPAVATSGDGRLVFVVGRGNDRGIWFARSSDAGQSFELAWARIGVGTFQDFAPAIACDASGRRVHVFGIGDDARAWQATSDDGGNQWALAWAPVLAGTFTSGLAAVCSGDGRRVRLFGRGMDNRLWQAGSDDHGSRWVGWAPVPAGSNFLSAPAAAVSWDGLRLHLCALGGDRKIWRAFSADGAATYALAWEQVDGAIF